MAKIDTPSTITDLPLAVVKNMIALATSGFGVVVALAWNEAIKNTVETYVDPYLGRGSGIASLLIYALLMTILAVLVTMQLSSIERKLEVINQALVEKAKKVKARERQLKEAKKESQVKKK